MRKLLVSILFIGVVAQTSFGQHRDIENKYKAKREWIKENKIKTIKQYISALYTGNKKKLETVFHFNKQGYLIEMEFGSNSNRKIEYNYNSKGEYISKIETFIDSVGANHVGKWYFTFNKSGDKVEERYVNHNSDTVITNLLEVDKKGNLTSMIRHRMNKLSHDTTSTKWTQKYDNDGKLIERQIANWNKGAWVTYSKTLYKYNTIGLIHKVIGSKPCDSTELFQERVYYYENDKLVSSREISPTETLSYTVRTWEYEYDLNGYLISETKYLYEKKFQSWIYEYEHY